ncbi:hypothetical protein RJ639_013606 [Escallonia herrerae]|uniref:Ubiquitin-like domain-containing protein n=1 Tax=Escallonia herrerae TaxID=1293975 RepID=A0AA88VJB1_9ASTE|nr:hypothetical protein RJ639_013606 [Escallonia herrerae]
MKVIVEILTGKVFSIQVDKDTTVADLKREIEAQEDLPNNRLILMFEGSLLNGNEAPLVEYGVGEGSHLFGAITYSSVQILQILQQNILM